MSTKVVPASQFKSGSAVVVVAPCRGHSKFYIVLWCIVIVKENLCNWQTTPISNFLHKLISTNFLPNLKISQHFNLRNLRKKISNLSLKTSVENEDRIFIQSLHSMKNYLSKKIFSEYQDLMTSTTSTTSTTSMTSIWVMSWQKITDFDDFNLLNE